MSKQYTTKPKHVRIVHRPPHSSSQLEPDPFLQPTTAKQPDRTWNPVNRSTWTDQSDDEDNTDYPPHNGNNGNINHPNIDNDDLDDDDDNDDEPPIEDINPAVDNIEIPTDDNSSDELSDGQAEDMLSDLHNLLFFHGPAAQGGDDADNDEADRVDEQAEAEAAADDEIPELMEDNLEDSLPQEFRYL